MSTKVIKLTSNLPFDEEQEQDIIKYIEELQQSHKIGQFLVTVIRAAYDCPELVDKNNGNISTGVIGKQIQDLGMSTTRYQFMKAVSKEVNDMKDKVDAIYDMVLKTYELGLMGKHLAIEDRAKNEILASFILQKQVKELQDKLGMQLNSSVFASNKAQDVEKFAEDALEYIINSYDSVLNELKAIRVNTVESKDVEVVNTEVKAIDAPKSEVNKPKVISSSVNTEDEVIDFGGNFNSTADVQALNNFFGM